MESVMKMFVEKIWKLGKDDPRRVIHALKVGLALSVVSLFYLMERLFDGVGDNAIWAIMTVVVVFEFTAGATLSKGLNRGIGTVLAACLAVSVGYIAEKAGTTGEAVIIGASCFLLGAAATYFRFFPKIKTKFDYGVLIFLLTFNMITVSGYRVDNIFRMAYERLSTIAIGCGVSLVISLCIWPIWAGEDLHRSIIKRIEGLADSLEGCMAEYLKGSEYCGMNDGESGKNLEDTIYKGYRDVLDSKASEESLANFASWEPRHGKFRFGHPWKQYVKVGGMLRHMAYCVVALHGCLQTQQQRSNLNRVVFKKTNTHKVGMEVAKILHEVADSIECMRLCPPSQSMMERLHVAVEDLNTSFRLQPAILHLIPPLYDSEENNICPEESTDHYVNPTQQSPITEDNLPHEYHMAIETTFKDNDNVHISHDGKSKDESNSELVSATTKKQFPLPNREGDSHVMLSIEPLNPMNKIKGKADVFDAVPLATFASLLIEIVARLEHLIEAVHDLGELAGFEP